jgi:hypothetical protein
MVKTSVQLPDDLKERLSRAAQISGESEAHVIRSALEWWLTDRRPGLVPQWGTIEFDDPSAESRSPDRSDQ